MLSRCYLMSVGEFLDGAEGEGLLGTAMGKMDSARRERAERMMPGMPRAACVGAGLLLQMAVRTAFGNGVCEEAGVEEGLAVYSLPQVMELVERPIELVMDYGERGKPYLREYPLFFNLSHSGEYVVCAVSDREIGVDIQKCFDFNVMRTAERFFSKEECRALAACGTEEEGRQFFFRLWTRKEAYGKLLGKGIMGVVSVNLLPDERNMVTERELLWREWSWPEGYRIAMCQRA